jgi:myo-inositol 2-dehydrogenase/D-chiro-inositol 1-dehydrogenase
VSGLRRNGAGQDVRLEVFGSLDSFGAGIDACTPMTSTEPGISPPALATTNSSSGSNAPSAPRSTHSFGSSSGTGVNLTPPRDGLVAIQIAQAAAESIRAGSIIDLD